MKNLALLGAVMVSLFVAEAASAGGRRGGCPGGVCSMAAKPAPAMAAAETKPALPKTEVAGGSTESTPATVEASTNAQPRYARTRLFGRRR